MSRQHGVPTPHATGTTTSTHDASASRHAVQRAGLALAATALLVAPFAGAAAWADPGNGNGQGQGQGTGQGSANGQGNGHGQGNGQGQGNGEAGGTDQPLPEMSSTTASAPVQGGGSQANGSGRPEKPGKPEKPEKPTKPATPGKPGKATPADPAGNNGTVKIAPYGEVDGIPQNTPHVGCTFQVEWYGFDQGADIVSTVGFAAHSPTRASQLSYTGPGTVLVGEDPASGAGTDSGLDAVAYYTLSFTGDPHPKQGYHVKLTIHTPRSKGNDTKSKVFWVQGCEASTPSTPTPTPSNPTPTTPAPTTPAVTTPATPAVPTPTPTVASETATATPSTSETPTAEVMPTETTAPDDTEVLGVQASVNQTPTKPTTTGVVPRAINAGLQAAVDAPFRTATWLGLGLVLAGLLTGAVARVRKSRA